MEIRQYQIYIGNDTNILKIQFSPTYSFIHVFAINDDDKLLDLNCILKTPTF